MNISSNVSAERWADLLTCFIDEKKPLAPGIGEIVFSDKGQRSIQIRRILLDNNQIMAITKEKITEAVNIAILEKIQGAMEFFIQKQKEERQKINPSLSSLAVRFTLWAKNYNTLAKILFVVTLGFFYLVWKRGDSILKDIENIDAVHKAFEGLSENVKQRRTIKNKEIDFEKMQAEEKNAIKMVDEYCEKVIERLNIKQYEEEIKKVKEMKSYLLEETDFTLIEVPRDAKEMMVIKYIAKALNLGHGAVLEKHLRLREDKFFAIIAVRNSCRFLSELSENFRDDRDIVLAAVTTFGYALEFASPRLKDDKEMVLAAVTSSGTALSYATERLCDVEEIILESVRSYPQAIYSASERLFKDREFILKILKFTGCLLEFLHEYQDDKECVLAALSSYDFALEHASNALQDDQEVILKAIAKDTNNLMYVSEEKCGVRAFILAAVKINGGAFRYASEELKKDEEIIIASLKDYPQAFEYASEKQKNDRNFILMAINLNAFILESLSEELRNDKEIVLAAVRKSGYALQFASPALQNDREVVLAAIKENPLALQFASRELLDDKDIVLQAVTKHGNCIYYVSTRLKSDLEILAAAGPTFVFDQFPECPEHLSDLTSTFDLREDKEFVLNILKFIKTDSLYGISSKLRRDKDFMLKAIKIKWDALGFAGYSLRNNRAFVSEAIKHNKTASMFATPQLKADPEILAAAAG